MSFAYLIDGDPTYHLHGGVEHNPDHEGHEIDCMSDMSACGLVLSQGRQRFATSVPIDEADNEHAPCPACVEAVAA